METINLLMQTVLEFLLLAIPTTAITWFAVTFIPVNETMRASEYFKMTPLVEIIWHMALYAFVTSWVVIVLTSILGCLFLRFTAAAPGLYPTRGFQGFLLMYRLKVINRIQRQWTWSITGQYLRALAGVRFTHLGASECDVMFDLVPELTRADTQVFWSNGSFTNTLDYGAEHIKLRQIDMPPNFFAGNNCVAESGHFPANFLLGVSTPGSDIRFRRQMNSRSGEPITVAGNPPVRFASSNFEVMKEANRLPSFSLFLARVFTNDVLSIGMLRITDLVVYVLLYTILLRLGGHVIVSAILALFFSEFLMVGACAAVKKILVGKWGSAHSTPFWSWRHFTYFLAQDCFFAWCRVPLGFSKETVLSNNILRLMGCRIGKRTIVREPMQAGDWNAVNFGNDCIIGGFLQFHTFEDMILKVKRTDIEDNVTVNFGTTIMGGVVIEAGTTLLPLSMVLKEMYLSTANYEGSPTAPLLSPQPAQAQITEPQPGGRDFDLSAETIRVHDNAPAKIGDHDDQ